MKYAGRDVRGLSVRLMVPLMVRTSAIGLALSTCTGLPAQQVQPAALKHGQLVVWVVHPSTAVPPSAKNNNSAARRPPAYSEQTAGSFGRPASEMGTPANSVGLPSDSPQISRTGRVDKTVAPADRDTAAAAAAGYREQTSASFGQTASTYGADASSHGQAPSTVGQNAGNVGTEASNYGQTAGSYGHSLNTIAQAGQPAVPEKPQGVETIVEPKLKSAYPELSAQFVNVDADKLSEKLLTASTSANFAAIYPDVLVFEGFPASWDGLPESVQRLAREAMGGSAPVKGARPGVQAARRVVVTMRSRRQATAVAFAEYLQNEGLLKLPPR